MSLVCSACRCQYGTDPRGATQRSRRRRKEGEIRKNMRRRGKGERERAGKKESGEKKKRFVERKKVKRGNAASPVSFSLSRTLKGSRCGRRGPPPDLLWVLGQVFRVL